MSYTCDICFLEKKKKHLLPCSHFLCKLCYNRLQKETCPFCRAPFKREKKKELVHTDPDSYRDLREDWVSFSRYLKSGVEIIETFPKGDIPKGWRNDSLTTIVKKRRRRYEK